MVLLALTAIQGWTRTRTEFHPGVFFCLGKLEQIEIKIFLKMKSLLSFPSCRKLQVQRRALCHYLGQSLHRWKAPEISWIHVTWNTCYMDCFCKPNFGLYKLYFFFFFTYNKHPEHEKESALWSYNVWISLGYYVVSFSLAYCFHTL